MLSPGNAAAYLYVKNYEKKASNNYKKILIGLSIASIAIAGVITAAVYIVLSPLLINILTAILVPLTFYFLYNLYNLCQTAYRQYYNKHNKAKNEALRIIALTDSSKAIQMVETLKQVKDLPESVPEFVKEFLKKLATQDSKKAFDLIICVERTESILRGVEQSIKDKFYDFILVSPNNINEVLKLAENIKYIESLMEEVRSSTRKKFYDHIITSIFNTNGFYNSQEVINFAESIKEIDNIVSSITNPDLRDNFDQSFTITEMQNMQERAELIKLAKLCKEANKTVPNDTRRFLAIQESPLPGIEITEVTNHLEMVPSIDEIRGYA